MVTEILEKKNKSFTCVCVFMDESTTMTTTTTTKFIDAQMIDYLFLFGEIIQFINNNNTHSLWIQDKIANEREREKTDEQ